ncbi:rCG23819 [Rattus norvegicus]|uniref:RCG23819 n=1 Tax=Rattus norvegicus TaxID=10116 RepID=A6JW87_RAT|nr:rCG23819 [Rattus norvegicus]
MGFVCDSQQGQGERMTASARPPKCLPTLQILHRWSCFTSTCSANEGVLSRVSRRCLGSNSHALDSVWMLISKDWNITGP